ncbi:MAG: hypothetical protein Q9188_005533, partial [Gyalolechia gomerana]
MIRKSFPLIIILFLSFPVYSISAALGKLNAFLDFNCMRASVINPTISIPIDTCLVSPNAYGFSIQTLPPCSAGTATLAMYWDTSCGNPVNVPSFQTEANCYVDDSGSHIRAIQFVCPEVDQGSVATSTTTATFGSSLIPIASDEPSSGGGPQPTTPSSNAAVPTSDSTSDSASSPSSTARNTNNSNDNSNDSSSGSGLSRNAQIGLGVGVPLAALVVALLAWWFPCRK